MVISSSNRTPSPMSTRPNPNPNPNPNSRTHQEREGVVPARKSFSGYPLGKPSIISQPRSFIPNTPANSPAEYAKRNSFSRDHEQKENERDNPNSKPIGARPRSPSVLKGSKNFMSPTISAASKINPSPRKKVLGERNEAIRTSASLSDGKFQFFSTSSMEFSDENEPKIDTEHPTTDFDKVQAKNVAELNPEGRRIESEPDSVVLSPEVPLNITESSDQVLPLSEMPKDVAESNVVLDVKSTTCSSPSVIAPLDADPSLPPYDPKTNYLSPRPQFLCYKPNPRIESYISQGLRLEDEFSSESCSETENSEATQSENSPKEQEDSSSSSTEGTSHIVEKPPSSESNPTESQETQVAVEPKIEPSSRFFTKSRTVVFALIFLLGLVSFSVTYAPGLGNATYRDEIISMVYNDPYVVVDLAKVNFNGLVQRADLAQVNFSGLVQRAKLWSAHSVDYLSQMIHSLRQVNEFNPVLFSNLTGWAEEEDYVVGDFELGSFFERKEDGDFIVEDFGLISFVGKEDGQGTTMDRSAENFAESESNPETEEQKPLVEETNLVMLGDSEPEKVEEKSVLPLDHCEDCLVDVEDLNADTRGQSSIHAAENPDVDHVQVQEEDISSDVGFGLENDAKAEGSSSQDAGVDHTQAENQEVDHVQLQEDISSDVGFGLENDTKAEGSSSQDARVDQTQVEDIGPDVELEFQNDAKGEDTSSQDPEVQPEVSSVPLGQDDDQSSLNNETVEMMEEVKTNYEVVPETTPRSTQLPLLRERSLAPTTTTISLVVASLLASASAAAVVFMKQRKANSAISVPLADQLTLKEKSTMEKSVARVKEPSMIHECPPSWSGPVEVDMSSEPCPSEMSSFQKTSSHSKRSGRRGADEAQSQSQERRPKRDNKRESLASSSSSEYTMCSSYGSFTSYSIIPSKKGDEEVVTPVRRSSRIRNQVTSP